MAQDLVSHLDNCISSLSTGRVLLLSNPRLWQGCIPKKQRGPGRLGFRMWELCVWMVFQGLCAGSQDFNLCLQLCLLLLPSKRAQHCSFSKPVGALSEVFSSSFHWLHPAQIPPWLPQAKFMINSLGPLHSIHILICQWPVSGLRAAPVPEWLAHGDISMYLRKRKEGALALQIRFFSSCFF